MTIVQGQIESLKKVKETLAQKGISRFNSISDINAFQKSFEREVRSIREKAEEAMNKEIDELRNSVKHLEHQLQNFNSEEVIRLKIRVNAIRERMRVLDEIETGNVLLHIYNVLRIVYKRIRANLLEKKINTLTQKATEQLQVDLFAKKQEFDNLRLNTSFILEQRCRQAGKDLEHTKQVLDELQPYIAGAVGEGKVQKELEKLPDNCYLFNDYSLKFSPPIYNRKDKDKIYSAQLDHLLLTPSGVFILETKNWSKASLENMDLRSPVQQIKRSSFALYTLLNSSKSDLSLTAHHWGDKEVPLRNVIVIINSRPKEKFKFVAVKTLNELNSYIEYFDPIFSDSDVKSIADFLTSLQKKYAPSSRKPIVSTTSRPKPSTPSSGKPNMQEWLAQNPGKGMNDYFSKFGQ